MSCACRSERDGSIRHCAVHAHAVELQLLAALVAGDGGLRGAQARSILVNIAETEARQRAADRPRACTFGERRA